MSQVDGRLVGRGGPAPDHSDADIDAYRRWHCSTVFANRASVIYSPDSTGRFAEAAIPGRAGIRANVAAGPVPPAGFVLRAGWLVPARRAGVRDPRAAELIEAARAETARGGSWPRSMRRCRRTRSSFTAIRRPRDRL